MEKQIQIVSIGPKGGTCRSCGAPIRWATTIAGKKMPLDADVSVNQVGDGPLTVDASATHWATCPNAKEHKKR